MLTTMRKGIGSWFVKIFLGLLVASFAVWGIGDVFRNVGGNNVAEVGEIEITPSEFLYSFRSQVKRFEANTGVQLDNEQALSLGFDRSVLSQLIGRAALDQFAIDSGLETSDEQLRRTIRQSPAFQDQLGNFDRFLFENVLRQNGMSESRYLSMLKSDLSRGALLDSVAINLEPPQDLAVQLYRYRLEARTAELIFIPAGWGAETVGEPDTATLETFHQENAARFSAPEYRNISFLNLRPEQLIDRMSANEQELRDYYDQRIDEFSSSETREIQQIILPDAELAERAKNRLASGEDFAAVALELAELEGDDISLGRLSRNDPAIENFSDDLFSAAQGDIVGPLESDFGWHVFRIASITPEEVRSYEDVKKSIEKDLLLERASEELYRLTTEVEDELGGGASLAEAAATLNLPLQTLTMIDQRGLDVNGDPVEGLPNAEDFLTVAFATPNGFESALTETNDGSFFILFVGDVTPSALRPLDEIRDRVISAWREQVSADQAETVASSLLSEISDISDMAALAKQKGLDYRKTDAIRRDQKAGEQDLSPTMVNKIFDLAAVGSTINGVSIDGGGQVVARLVSITHPDPASDPEGLKGLTRQIAGSFTTDVLTQYQRHLEDRYGVAVNQPMLTSLFNDQSF